MKTITVLTIAMATIFLQTEAKICHFHCPRIYKPVCGHNGGTYDNECLMRIAACETGEAIIKMRDGKCPEDIGDVNKRCPNKMCPAIYAPVCGSDGELYANECILTAKMCRYMKAITVVSHARLSSKKSNCEDCLIPCNKMLKPVCGSDGKTYANECTMRVASCKQRKAIIAVENKKCTN